MIETIEIKMTWAYAMEIYLACLESGTEQGKQAARDDLRKLARTMDKINEEAGQ